LREPQRHRDSDHLGAQSFKDGTANLRVDPQVISYFKALAVKTGVPYQSLINYVLKDYALHRLEPSANSERIK